MDLTTESNIGTQIRELRKARGMTLTDLADRIGRSVGYVSQAERNKSEVSIACLTSIAAELKVDLSWFFNDRKKHDNSENQYIVRANSRRQLNFIGTGMTEELLSPQLNGDSLMILNKSQPQAQSGGPIQRDVEMTGYVITGKLKLIIDNNQYELTKGDSFTLPPNVSHDFENIGTDTCEVIWYLTPAIY